MVLLNSECLDEDDLGLADMLLEGRAVRLCRQGAFGGWGIERQED